MHRKGVEAEKYIKEAKETFAKLLKVQEKEIFFTSGGTESDNLALIGAAKANRRAGEHLIASGIEHPAIINYDALSGRGRISCYISSGGPLWKNQSGCTEGCTL